MVTFLDSIDTNKKFLDSVCNIPTKYTKKKKMLQKMQPSKYFDFCNLLLKKRHDLGNQIFSTLSTKLF